MDGRGDRPSGTSCSPFELWLDRAGLRRGAPGELGPALPDALGAADLGRQLGRDRAGRVERRPGRGDRRRCARRRGLRPPDDLPAVNAGRRPARSARRSKREAAHWPRWEVERTRYMVWRGGSECEYPPATRGAREVRLAEIEDAAPGLDRRGGRCRPAAASRTRRSTSSSTSNGRYREGGRRPLVRRPRRRRPRSGCCLLTRRGGIGQVEDVGTLEPGARTRLRQGDRPGRHGRPAAGRRGRADLPHRRAADWPQLMYAQLGFETVGDLTVLRRRPLSALHGDTRPAAKTVREYKPWLRPRY